MRMQDAPDVDVIVRVKINDDIRVSIQPAAAQPGKIKVMTPPWRTRGRSPCNTLEGILDCADKAQGNVLTSFGQIVGDRLFDILPRSLAREDGFQAHDAAGLRA